MMGLLKAARRGWIESFLGLVGRERKLVMQQGSVDELAEVGLGWCFINRLFSSPGVEGTLHMSIDSLSDSNGCYAVEPRLSGMDDGRRRIGYCVVEYTTEDGKRVSKTFNFDGDTLPFELASAVVEFMP